MILFRNARTTSESMSPPSIFSTIDVDDSSDTSLTAKQMKKMLKGENVKNENVEKQQIQNKNGIFQKDFPF
jgi:hypothetical protein